MEATPWWTRIDSAIVFSSCSTSSSCSPSGFGDSPRWSWTISNHHFCPKLYCQGALNTWSDIDLFERLDYTGQQARVAITSAFPPYLLKRYPWGFRKQAALPYGFVFLKRKKQWTKGRTLISYFQSYQANLLKAVSRALDSMLQQMRPQIMGQLNTPAIWARLHRHFEDVHTDITLTFVNHDLVGFFNSVPQERLLDAVNQLVDAWTVEHLLHFPDLQSVNITVDISAQGDPTQSTFSGSYRKSAYNLKKIYVQDILTVVRSSLSSHIFSALGCFWKQIRGAGIGSQISPSFSNLAVTIVERTWQQIDLETLDQPRFAFFGIRYVNNRFVIATEEAKLHPGFLMLCDLDFYGHPVELWGRWWWLACGFFCWCASKNCSI